MRIEHYADKQFFIGDVTLKIHFFNTLQSHTNDSKIREISRNIFRKGESVAYYLDKMRAVEIDSIYEEMYAKTHSSVQEVAAVSIDQVRRISDAQRVRRVQHAVSFRNAKLSSKVIFSNSIKTMLVLSMHITRRLDSIAQFFR